MAESPPPQPPAPENPAPPSPTGENSAATSNPSNFAAELKTKDVDSAFKSLVADYDKPTPVIGAHPVEMTTNPNVSTAIPEKLDIDAEAAKLRAQFNPPTAETVDQPSAQAQTPTTAAVSPPPPPEVPGIDSTAAAASEPSQPTAQTTEAPQAEQPVAQPPENALRPELPENPRPPEPDAPKTEADKSVENKDQTHEQKAAQNMKDILTTLDKYGVKLSDANTQELADTLIANPEMMDSFKNELAKGEKIGAELKEVFKNNGIDISDAKGLQMATDQIIENFTQKLEQPESEWKNSDGSTMSSEQVTEEKKKLNIFLRILKTLGKVVAVSVGAAVMASTVGGAKLTAESLKNPA